MPELRRFLIAIAVLLLLGGGFLGFLAAESWQTPKAAAGPLAALAAPIPSVVQGLGGPIRINIVQNPVDEDGEELWGSFEAATRTIEIEANAALTFQWHILGHELCHAVLFDSGLINTLSDAGQEALCDAMGTARIQEMRD